MTIEIDVKNRRVRDGSRPVSLKGKAFQVLLYFAQRFGQLVTANDLWDLFERSIQRKSATRYIHVINRAFARKVVANRAPGEGWDLTERIHLVNKPAMPVAETPEDETQASVTDLWPDVAERTYFKYRDEKVPLIDSPELVHQLEERYGCEAVRLGNQLYPVTIVWQNDSQPILPDDVLGELDKTSPAHFSSSPIMNEDEYALARQFIKEEYTRGPIKWEGVDYCMSHIDLAKTPPQICGRFGWYYDNILTQYAMEWELKKALQAGSPKDITRLLKGGALPLREAIERRDTPSPICNGTARCTAITVSMLFLFVRDDSFYCLLRRRSLDVGVSPGMLHVVPAGMFEAPNTIDNWSVKSTLWREFLEEVYNEKEEHGSGESAIIDHLLEKEPVKYLTRCIEEGSAQFSVTGICCDLLNLRPEICTVLVVHDPKLFRIRNMNLNWEYMKEGRAGMIAFPWQTIDEAVASQGSGFVASGAACFKMGRDWIESQLKI